jgi:hypothetical protein
MSTQKESFPRARETEEDVLDQGDESRASVAQFVYGDLFPRVLVIQSQFPLSSPPPIESLMNEDSGDQEFVVERRKLSYLGNILRSW